MKSFFKVVLATMLGMFLTGVLLFIMLLIVAGLAFSGMKDEVEVPERTVLEFRLPMAFPERTPFNPLDVLDESGANTAQLGLLDIFESMDRAAGDPRIKGIVIRPEMLMSGMASVAEVRNKILSFRKSGKFVYCYADFLSETGYYLASACDQIVLNPSGEMMFDGFAGGVVMYKGLLDKAGISFQVFRAGKYKSAVEPFIQKELSSENREQVKHLVSSMYSVFIRDIADARKLDTANLLNYAANLEVRGPAEAMRLKLIDGVMPYHQFVEMVEKKAGLSSKSEKKWLAVADYHKTSKEKESFSKDKIAVVYGVGEIEYGTRNEPELITSKTLAESIRKAREDKQVRAVVLRVNSPGGSSLASDIIAREVELTRKIKPVIASFGDVAASGGYYIACLADTILCLPQTITGSIGVFGLFPNTQKLFQEHLGLAYESVPTSENSDFTRPDKPLNAAQSSYIQHSVDRIYDDFLNIVARGRKLDTSYVHSIAQGRVWPGTDALAIKLADVHGGFESALKIAAAKAKISKYRVVEYPENRFSLSAFFGNLGNVDASLRSALDISVQ
jgi:protease-4